MRRAERSRTSSGERMRAISANYCGGAGDGTAEPPESLPDGGGDAKPEGCDAEPRLEAEWPSGSLCVRVPAGKTARLAWLNELPCAREGRPWGFAARGARPKRRPGIPRERRARGTGARPGFTAKEGAAKSGSAAGAAARLAE